MKSFAFAVLALLAVQSVAAFSKPVYEPKKPVYEPKKAVYVAKKPVVTPSPVPPPAPKPVTITCAPKPVIASVPAALNCTDGYAFTVDAKQGPICSKELCIQPYVEKKAAPAKPMYKKPVYVFKKGNYFYGKKVAEKKPVYEPKKPVYTPAPTPVYIAPQPSPAPKICRIDVIPAIYVCEAGYTFDKATKSCLISVPGPCPPTYTASAGVCSYTFIPSPAPKPVYEPKKPVYSSKGHYFMGKKMEYATPAPTPATLPYCVYPEPSPSPKPVKPVYEPKKPKYEPKKVDIKGLFSKLG